MKNFWILLLVAVFFATPALAFDSNLSKAKSNGDIVLSGDVVNNVGLGDPRIIYTNLTGATDVAMTYNESTNEWVGNIGRKIKGRFSYCIEFDYSNMFFPHEYVKMGIIEPSVPRSFDPTQPLATDNNGGGFNTNIIVTK